MAPPEELPVEPPVEAEVVVGVMEGAFVAVAVVCAPVCEDELALWRVKAKMLMVLITSTTATAPIIQSQRVCRRLFGGEGEKLVVLAVSCLGE